jgi:hypothetical protein
VKDRGRGGVGGHKRENKNQRGLLWSCLPHSISPLAIGRKNEDKSTVNPLSTPVKLL